MTKQYVYQAYLMTREKNPQMTGEVLEVCLAYLGAEPIAEALRVLKNAVRGTDRMICYTEIKEV